MFTRRGCLLVLCLLLVFALAARYSPWRPSIAAAVVGSSSSRLAVIANTPDPFPRAAPVVIGAGQGTTGTHLFHHASCCLGYLSLHFNIGCVPEALLASKGEARRTLMRLLRTQDAVRSPKTKLEKDAGAFLEYYVKNLERLVLDAKRLNVTLALHDTPYPAFLPHFIDIVKLHHGGQPPLVVLGERDPHAWATRRVEKRYGQIVCRDENSRIDERTLKGGAMDSLTGLAGKDGSWKRTNNETFPRASEFLYMILDMAEARGIDAIAEQMKEYQDAVRAHAILSYDMFARGNKTETEELAGMMARATAPFLDYGGGRFVDDEGRVLRRCVGSKTKSLTRYYRKRKTRRPG